MEGLTKILAVGVGGAFGAMARYVFNLIFAKTFAPFPFATFFINITGSFLIGFLLTVFSEKFEVNENVQLAIIVGFLGAYTTFSTFEFEIFGLVRDKQFLITLFYVILSVTIGFFAVWLGRLSAKII